MLKKLEILRVSTRGKKAFGSSVSYAAAIRSSIKNNSKKKVTLGIKINYIFRMTILHLRLRL